MVNPVLLIPGLAASLSGVVPAAFGGVEAALLALLAAGFPLATTYAGGTIPLTAAMLTGLQGLWTVAAITSGLVGLVVLH